MHSVRGVTIGLRKRLSSGFQLEGNYVLAKDEDNDSNERDPFTFRYAKVTDLDAEYGYSDRDQRHRLNTIFVWKGPGDVNFNFRYAYRSAQPKSITATGADANTPQDRINADGSVTQRNLGRKDNEFSSLDLRLSGEAWLWLVLIALVSTVVAVSGSASWSPGVTPGVWLIPW